MQFTCYSDWNQLPPSSHRLFDAHAKHSLFFSRAWFECLRQLPSDDGQSLLLACVEADKQLLAILPLMHSEDGHLVSLKHFYTSLYSLLLVEQNQQQVLNCLARGLHELGTISLRLDPVAEDDGNLRGLQQALEAIGYQSHRHFRFYNWIYRVNGQSFDDYMATRPSRVRNTIARKRRKLQREHEVEIRIYSDQQLAQGLADYHAVYRASWKAHEQFESFIEELAQTLAKSGWLRLGVLYIDSKPAAAQFWFVVDRKASIFKLVYDQAWKQYSPGSILISELMRQVIDIDQVEEIDFLTGNDAYKQDWMSQRRQRWMLSLFKPREPRSALEHYTAPLKALFAKK